METKIRVVAVCLFVFCGGDFKDILIALLVNRNEFSKESLRNSVPLRFAPARWDVPAGKCRDLINGGGWLIPNPS